MARQERQVNLVLAFVLATACVEDVPSVDLWGGWNRLLLLLLLLPYRKLSLGNKVCNPGGSPPPFCPYRKGDSGIGRARGRSSTTVSECVGEATTLCFFGGGRNRGLT